MSDLTERLGVDVDLRNQVERAWIEFGNSIGIRGDDMMVLRDFIMEKRSVLVPQSFMPPGYVLLKGARIEKVGIGQEVEVLSNEQSPLGEIEANEWVEEALSNLVGRLQGAIGVNDGGYAAVHFDEDWNGAFPALVEYANAEIENRETWD